MTGRSYARIAMHVRLAVIGVLLFGSISITSGRIREGNGLGYDAGSASRRKLVSCRAGRSWRSGRSSR